MPRKTITFIVVGDGCHRRFLLTMTLHHDRTYIVDLPVHDIKHWEHAQMNIIISQDEEEP